MKNSLLVIAVATAFLVAGCSSPPTAGSAPDAAQAAPSTATASRPPTKTGGTVADFGAVISDHQQKWGSEMWTFTDCATAWRDIRAGKSSASAVRCAAVVSNLASDAMSAAHDLTALSPAPPEIQPLVERTKAALARLGANPVDSDCKDVSSAACEADFTNANNDLWPVNQIVKEWAPYMK